MCIGGGLKVQQLFLSLLQSLGYKIKRGKHSLVTNGVLDSAVSKDRLVLSLNAPGCQVTETGARLLASDRVRQKASVAGVKSQAPAACNCHNTNDHEHNENKPRTKKKNQIIQMKG